VGNSSESNFLDGHCVSFDSPWGITESAPSNAHLSAVLAGFMMSAIVFLLRRDDTNGGQAAKAHTVALFYAGVAVLGVGSYLFGALGSTRLPGRPGGDSVCVTAWSQGMAASGMLGVGGVLLIAGLGWIISDFARNSHSTSWFLAGLGNMLTFVMILTESLMLLQASIHYIRALAAQPFEISLLGWTGALKGIVGVVCVASLALIGARTYMLRKNIRGEQPWLAETKARDKAIILAICVTAALTLAGPLFEEYFFEHARPNTVWMTSAISLCQILPSVVFVAIAYSVPGPPFRWETRSSDAVAVTATADRQG
jgi:hypothetical protein